MKTKPEQALNDAARKVTLRHGRVIVPLKFDRQSKPATEQTVILKSLSLDDLAFLSLWREHGWDVDKATAASTIALTRIPALIKKLQVFRDEETQVKALAEIPTPAWIAAKHVENVYNGGTLEDSEHKSLQELAKIEGAYKQQAPNTQITIWNLPELPPEQTAKLKEIFDTNAEAIHDPA